LTRWAMNTRTRLGSAFGQIGHELLQQLSELL
jgi:hypothetical protein